jgi:hypothetical protein
VWLGGSQGSGRLLGAFEVGGHAERGALQHLDELPALLAPLVQDLLQGVRDERHGCVFPFLLVQGSSKRVASRSISTGRRRVTYFR